VSCDEWLFTRVARGAGPAAMLGPAFQQRERKAMATWKRLTQNLSTPVKIDVNMDAVATMERNEDYTIVTFAFARGDHQYALNVKETPEEIRTLPPLPSR
jgi:hypothetical protein